MVGRLISRRGVGSGRGTRGYEGEVLDRGVVAGRADTFYREPAGVRRFADGDAVLLHGGLPIPEWWTRMTYALRSPLARVGYLNLDHYLECLEEETTFQTARGDERMKVGVVHMNVWDIPDTARRPVELLLYRTTSSELALGRKRGVWQIGLKNNRLVSRQGSFALNIAGDRSSATITALKSELSVQAYARDGHPLYESGPVTARLSLPLTPQMYQLKIGTRTGSPFMYLHLLPPADPRLLQAPADAFTRDGRTEVVSVGGTAAARAPQRHGTAVLGIEGPGEGITAPMDVGVAARRRPAGRTFFLGGAAIARPRSEAQASGAHGAMGRAAELETAVRERWAAEETARRLRGRSNITFQHNLEDVGGVPIALQLRISTTHQIWRGSLMVRVPTNSNVFAAAELITAAAARLDPFRFHDAPNGTPTPAVDLALELSADPAAWRVDMQRRHSVAPFQYEDYPQHRVLVHLQSTSERTGFGIALRATEGYMGGLVPDDVYYRDLPETLPGIHIMSTWDQRGNIDDTLARLGTLGTQYLPTQIRDLFVP